MSLFSRFLKAFQGRGEPQEKEPPKKPPFQQYQRPHLPEKPTPERPVVPVSVDAETRSREIVLEARDEAFRIKHAAEEEARKIRTESIQIETRLAQKEENLDKRMTSLEVRERENLQKTGELSQKLLDIEKIKEEQIARLERAARLTTEEAKTLIMQATETKLKEEMAKRIREIEAETKSVADEKAKEILVNAMMKAATDYVAECTVSTVKLPDEEIKGRIIGKEGRNIRTLEQETGVDVDFDETPGEIRLSSFDPVRREIAKVSLERLIVDGRIQPARIEEIVRRTKTDIEKIMHEEGEKLCHAVGVYNLPIDKVNLLGRYKYRFSYGQNMIAHTLEETRLGVALATEVKANINIVRLGCLLHDIGKVITEEEGTHVELGVDLLKKNHMPPEVVACVQEHHEDKPFSSIESMIVYIADAISGSRPGARYEDYEKYVQRMEKLESIAKEFQGVKEAWVFQAGREMRVLVDPEKVDDAASYKIAQDVKNRIQSEIKDFPGQIKVTVIRELRAIETVK
jgi:ribonuclease Y